MVKGVIMRIQPTTVYKVENKNAYRSANPNYYLIVTDNEGEMLFTKSSIKDAKQRAKSNPEDVPKYRKINSVDWCVCAAFAFTCSIAGGLIGYFSDFIFNKLT